MLKELEGHTETIDVITANSSGKLIATGGLNNVIHIWKTTDQNIELKCQITEGPNYLEDLNFLEWHPKGNALLTGGKDKFIWIMNGVSGSFVACLSGHKEEVL